MFNSPSDGDSGLQQRLRQLRLECSPAPSRESLLARLALKQYSTSKEVHSMGIWHRWFSGRTWPLRLAAGLAILLLLLALSQLLPFAGGVRYAPRLEAASGGYVLIFNFGPERPSEAMHEQGHKIIQQWVEDNHIDLEQMTMNGGQDVVDGQYSVSLALIGATREQADSLAAALGSLPGAPVAQVVEASWYQVEAAEAKKRGELLLYEFDHAFIFTRGTSAEQVKQTLREYLIQTRGSCDIDIDVKLEWTAKGNSCTINVSPLKDSAEESAD